MKVPYTLLLVTVVLAAGCVSTASAKQLNISGTWHAVGIGDKEPSTGWAMNLTVVEGDQGLVGSNSTGGTVSGWREGDNVYIKVHNYTGDLLYILEGAVEARSAGRFMQGAWRKEDEIAGEWSASRIAGWR